MPITAPAYNPELNSDRETLKPNILLVEKFIQKPQYRSQESNLPFISLGRGDDDNISTEATKENIKRYLPEFFFIEPSLMKLAQFETYLDDLYFIQQEAPKYFDNYELILEHFVDPEEENESFRVLIKTNLELTQAFLQEDLFFDEVFSIIYINTKGGISLRVEPNGF